MKRVQSQRNKNGTAALKIYACFYVKLYMNRVQIINTIKYVQTNREKETVSIIDIGKLKKNKNSIHIR